MNIADINASCKSTIFKSILTNVIYAYRLSFKKLTGAKVDIKLDKIRTTPINNDGIIINGRIKNLIGGRIACSFDKEMVKFLDSCNEYISDQKAIEIFASDLFDIFSTISNNSIFEISPTSEDGSHSWNNSIYYVRFDTKIISDNGKVIPSKFIISLDELTSIYFKS